MHGARSRARAVRAGVEQADGGREREGNGSIPGGRPPELVMQAWPCASVCVCVCSTATGLGHTRRAHTHTQRPHGHHIETHQSLTYTRTNGRTDGRTHRPTDELRPSEQGEQGMMVERNHHQLFRFLPSLTDTYISGPKKLRQIYVPFKYIHRFCYIISTLICT